MNKAVAVFSLETTSSALMQRLLSSRAKVDLQLIRAGFLSERDFPKLTAAASALAMAKLFIDDTPRMSLTVLRARAQQLKSQHDIQLIVVDYFQLLHLASRESNRQLEIAEISADLKQLAKELSAPVIIIAQLSQQSVLGSRPPQVRAPWRSDLWELGSLERDADLVGLLLRAAYYATEEGATIEVADEAELIVTKQRNGPTGAIPLTFFARHARFETRAQESPKEA